MKLDAFRETLDRRARLELRKTLFDKDTSIMDSLASTWGRIINREPILAKNLIRETAILELYSGNGSSIYLRLVRIELL